MAFKNRFFPGLDPQSILIWEAHLAANPDLYANIDYDIRVGLGRDPGKEFNSNIRRMALRASQRRIDAAGQTPGAIQIIEITDSAGQRALGQLASYPDLYRAAFSPTLPLLATLVAREIQTDMTKGFQNAGVLVFLYPEVSPPSNTILNPEQ